MGRKKEELYVYRWGYAGYGSKMVRYTVWEGPFPSFKEAKLYIMREILNRYASYDHRKAGEKRVHDYEILRKKPERELQYLDADVYERKDFVHSDKDGALTTHFVNLEVAEIGTQCWRCLGEKGQRIELYINEELRFSREVTNKSRDDRNQAFDEVENILVDLPETDHDFYKLVEVNPKKKEYRLHWQGHVLPKK